MVELKEMVAEKHINKSFFRFSGCDSTNAMSVSKIAYKEKYSTYHYMLFILTVADIELPYL